MSLDNRILGLSKLGAFLKSFVEASENEKELEFSELQSVVRRSEVENPWFTQDNQLLALRSWGDILTVDCIKNWLQKYEFNNSDKKIGLILAGNIPLVGFHDVISVILSGHYPLVKLSSKDRLMIPFLLKKWNEFSSDEIKYEFVEKLENYDAVIATGSNNTARYLEYYFKNSPSIIRKNRTSVAILTGKETNEEIQLLAKDIFTYFGLGCRNVTRLFVPKELGLERLFENFLDYQDIINHHKYANNYDYNRAIYLLNQDVFWDNNFVMLKEDEKLFSPLSVINFTRYESITDVEKFVLENKEEIQCVVGKTQMRDLDLIPFGEAQKPALSTYADNVDTLEFLQNL